MYFLLYYVYQVASIVGLKAKDKDRQKRPAREKKKLEQE